MTPLHRTLRQMVNRLAHAHGVAHAEAVKRHLFVELEAMREQGAPYAELVVHVDRLNTVPGPILPKT